MPADATISTASTKAEFPSADDEPEEHEGRRARRAPALEAGQPVLWRLRHARADKGRADRRVKGARRVKVILTTRVYTVLP